MRKYKIPQEVQREDRIFGPITMRRLIILCLGGGGTWLFYIKLASSGAVVWFPPVFLFGSLTLSFAFVELFGMKFGKFLTRILEFFILPKKRIWDKRFSHNAIQKWQHSQDIKWNKKQKKIETPESIFSQKEEQRKKIRELSPFLDGDLSKINTSLYQSHGGKK